MSSQFNPSEYFTRRQINTLMGTSQMILAEEIAAARSAADAANAELARIASDNVLSAGEKSEVILFYNTVLAEQKGIDKQATAPEVAILKKAYDKAISNLVAYMATLLTPVPWDVTPGDTDIVGTVFRQKFGDVYSTRQALLNSLIKLAIDTSLETQLLVEAVRQTSLMAQDIATSASQAASAAQHTADAAQDVATGSGQAAADAALAAAAAQDSANSAATAAGEASAAAAAAAAANSLTSAAVIAAQATADSAVTADGLTNLLAVNAGNVASAAQAAADGAAGAASGAAAAAAGAASAAAAAQAAAGFAGVDSSAAIALASSALNAPVLVVVVMPVPSAAGNYVYLPVANGGTSKGLYQSTGSVWVRQNTSDLVVDKIVAGQITAGAVTANAFIAGSVIAVAMAANAITAECIAAGAVTANAIAAGSITANAVAAGGLTANAIAAGTITALEIAAGTITATQIKAGTIDATKINLPGITIGGNVNFGATDANSGTLPVANHHASIQPIAGLMPAEAGAEKTTGKSIDILADGATYARVKGAGLISGGVNFASGSHSGLLPYGNHADSIRAAIDSGGKLLAAAVAGATNMIPGAAIVGTSITDAQIATNAIIANKIAANQISTDKLATGGLAVGGAGSMPVSLSVVDTGNNPVAAMGLLGVSGQSGWGTLGQNVYGGWLKNLALGGTPGSPSLWLDGNATLRGANGPAIDLLGNLILKNCVQVPGVTPSPAVGTTAADLPELGVGNALMSPALQGNPCLVSIAVTFQSMNAGTGQLATVGMSGGWWYSDHTGVGATVSDPTGTSAVVNINWLSGSAYDIVLHSMKPYWYIGNLYIYSSGSNYTNPSISISAGGTLFNGGSGSAPEVWATVSASGPNSGVAVVCQVSLDNLTNVILDSGILLTNSAGVVTWSSLVLLMPSQVGKGSHTFRVQAAKTGTYPLVSSKRTFSLVELG